MTFENPFIATGIGSFPHKDERELFPLILQSFPESPFWPQLPKRSFFEGMVVQYSQGFPGLRLDEKEQRAWVDTTQDFDDAVYRFFKWLEDGELEPFQIKGDFARGLRITEELAHDKYRKNARYIKGQVTGPVTFGLSLKDQEKKPIFYDPTLREILVKHLSSKARWMEKKFNDLFPELKTIFFFDEPSLSSFGSAFSSLSREQVVLSLNECLSSVKGLKGVHCCGNTDWSLLFSIGLDILSFDAYGFFETLSLYPKELSAFLERGGVLAWGIVPTSEDILREDVQSLVHRFEQGVDTLTQKGIDPTFLRRTMITPSCGTASLPIPLAERVCRVTAEVSKTLKEKV